VNEKTFTLTIKETLVGSHESKEISIHKFVDWTCSSRWKPYQLGQEVIAFLLKRKERHGSPYYLQSAGSEGEFEVIGDTAFYTGYTVPGLKASEDKEAWGFPVKLGTMLSAIRDYKTVYRLKQGKNSWDVLPEQVGSDEEVETYRRKSLLHEHLVSTTPQ
jgi:hypothetical protein